MHASQTLMTAAAMNEALDALAEALLARHADATNLALVGVQRRGVTLAARLAALMEQRTGESVAMGTLDITLYRDDWTSKRVKAVIGETRIPFDVAGKILVLVDDVLFTGRTVRAALEALADFGRPGKVELLVLVDRGHRELPIHADYAGLTVKTRRADRVDVLVRELDGEDGVRLAIKDV